jgi:DNA-binding response OmpR family regulator
MNKKILIVEDDKILAANLESICSFSDFDCINSIERDVIFDLVSRSAVDFIIMDLGLPNDDGIDIIHGIRKINQIPILILTGRTTIDDCVKGLEAGADDYMTKPYAGAELIARIKTIFRRVGVSLTPHNVECHLIRFGASEFNPATRTLKSKLSDRVLTEKEAALFTAICVYGGKIDRHAAYETVFNKKWHPGDRQLDVHISNLRQKLSDSSGIQNTIKSMRGLGYKLIFDYVIY